MFLYFLRVFLVCVTTFPATCRQGDDVHTEEADDLSRVWLLIRRPPVQGPGAAIHTHGEASGPHSRRHSRGRGARRKSRHQGPENCQLMGVLLTSLEAMFPSY